jgi:hypothetical protein
MAAENKNNTSEKNCEEASTIPCLKQNQEQNTRSEQFEKSKYYIFSLLYRAFCLSRHNIITANKGKHLFYKYDEKYGN